MFSVFYWIFTSIIGNAIKHGIDASNLSVLFFYIYIFSRNLTSPSLKVLKLQNLYGHITV